jgi:LCP family protein required for cell wall assembly
VVAWLWSVWARVYHRSPDVRPDDGQITNILILGIDQLDDEPSRADSIIVMSIHKETQGISMVSIPRDSRVEIPGFGLDKINHAMAFGDIELMRDTVEQLLEVSLHYYVYTNFSGFKGIVDTLGGIDVDVERIIIGHDGRPIVEPGLQRISGSQALTYVRFRSDFEGDFGRMRRQQQVLKAIGKRIKQPMTIIRLPALLEQLAQDVRTDMPIPQLFSLERTLSRTDFADINTIQLAGTSTLIDGVSYVILDMEFLWQAVRRYLRWEKRGSDFIDDRTKTPVNKWLPLKTTSVLIR